MSEQPTPGQVADPKREQERLIFEALGAASMCWSREPSGVFESRRAENIGRDLIAALDKLAEGARAAPQLEPADDPVQQAAILRDWLVDADAKSERLSSHLKAVLEVARVWMPDYATSMDRQTLRLAAAETGDADLLLLLAAPSAHPVPADWRAIEKLVHDYIHDYEYDPGEGCAYDPNENERALITDAIVGLLSDDEFVALFRASAHPVPVALTKEALDVASELEFRANSTRMDMAAYDRCALKAVKIIRALATQSAPDPTPSQEKSDGK